MKRGACDACCAVCSTEDECVAESFNDAVEDVAERDRACDDDDDAAYAPAVDGRVFFPFAAVASLPFVADCCLEAL